MWELLTAIFQNHGIWSLVLALAFGAVAYLYSQNQKKNDQLITLYRERVKDVNESKDRYEELAHKLDQSIDLLIKVFKRNSD